MKKTTKPIGKDTRNLTANVGNDLYGDVGRLAAISGCKQGEYVRAVLEYARSLGLLVRDKAVALVERRPFLAPLRRDHAAARALTRSDTATTGAPFPFLPRTVRQPAHSDRDDLHGFQRDRFRHIRPVTSAVPLLGAHPRYDQRSSATGRESILGDTTALTQPSST